MKRAILNIAFAAVAVMGAVSCEKERDFDRSSDSDAIRFSSFRRQVFTRADVDMVDYEPGTKYTILAVKHQDAEADYAWYSDWGFSEENRPQVGQESDGHAISYEPTAFFPRDSHLDFYALTYGQSVTAAPTLDATPADGVTPSITIRESAEDRLPDLQHSNEAKNLTSASGIINLPFEHALAAVNFLVSKQDESKDEDHEKQLMDVKITEIRLENVAEQATMNLVTGQWSWTSSDIGARVAYPENAGDAGVAIPVNATEIGAKDLLIFPNDDGNDENNIYDGANPYKYFKPEGDESVNKGEQVIVTIKLEGLKQYDPEHSTAGNPVYKLMEKELFDGTMVHEGKAEIRYPVRVYSDEDGSDKGPLHFLRNHKYVLSIFVMRDNVRIVTVSPQVYEWQDVNVNATLTDGALGQPVVFGGLMWMDRNLGASSADCEHDWWHSCGHFYQYARNIPYIINLDAILDTDGKSEKPGLMPRAGEHPVNGDVGEYGLKFHTDTGSPAHGTSFSDSRQFYMFYTFDDEGNRCYDWYGGKDYIYEPDVEARTLTNRTYVALRPGEKGFYGMMNGGSNTSTWAWKPNQTFEPRSQQVWVLPVASESEVKRGNPANQPVPKGWRMPTRADGYKILPEPAQTAHSWMSYAAYLFQGRISDLDQNISTAGSKILPVLEGDDYRFQYVRGRIHINFDETPDAQGLTSIGIGSGDGEDAAPCIYGIKHQGTSKAYRIRIRRMHSNVDGRYFLRISQYPSNETEIFRTNLDPTGTQNSKALSYNGTAVTKWNLQEFDWDHPAGELDFPLQGYIDAGGSSPYWNQIGICTIMRLPEYESNTTGTNWTFYMRNATSGVAVGASSRRALGDCIRLVRDIEATDEED